MSTRKHPSVLFVKLCQIVACLSVLIPLVHSLLIVNDSPLTPPAQKLIFPFIIIIINTDLCIPIINVAYVFQSVSFDFVFFSKIGKFLQHKKKRKIMLLCIPHSMCNVYLLSSTCQIIAIKFSVLSFAIHSFISHSLKTLVFII